MRKDIIDGLNINLDQFMEIIKPVNYTGGLSRWKSDHKWLEGNGISNMIHKLKEIMVAVEYLKDMASPHFFVEDDVMASQSTGKEKN